MDDGTCSSMAGCGQELVHYRDWVVYGGKGILLVWVELEQSQSQSHTLGDGRNRSIIQKDGEGTPGMMMPLGYSSLS